MGDGSLSVFDSVVDAVNCAAAIQRTAAERNKAVKGSDRLVMRIGINVGDVVLQDNDVYGDGVNVAARIEPLCEPAESWYRARRSTTCRARSTSRSNLPASSRSRTSAGQCVHTGPASTALPRLHLRCRSGVVSPCR